MPKIKFSTLVSGVKGKSNGSVFSTNSGGAYFRTNKTGGGKKSARWDKNKAGFSSLAQSWKMLSDEEQEAWNNATLAYMTLNAFGDSRKPSGYELFMRLNGALIAVNKPVLTLPAVPRELPSVGASYFETPDLFQFLPQRAINLVTPNTSGLESSVSFGLGANPIDIYSPYCVSIRLKLPANYQTILKSGELINIFDGRGAGEKAFQVYFNWDNSIGAVLNVGYNFQSGECFSTTPIDDTVLKNDFSLLITSEFTKGNRQSIWVNGIEQVSDYSVSGVQQSFAMNEVFSIGTVNTSDFPCGVISDFRYYNQHPDERAIKLIALGYVDELIDISLSMTSIVNGEVPVFGNFTQDITAVVPSYMSQNQNVVMFSGSVVPQMVLNVENKNIKNTRLNVYMSPPVSGGINGKFSNFKMIGSFAFGENVSFDLSDGYRAIYGNVPNTSNLLMKFQILDEETGVLTALQANTTPRRQRFRSGSEISSAVS